MCLHTNQLKPFIAKEDILCYKAVYKISDNAVMSYYQQFGYKLNNLYTIPILHLAEDKSGTMSNKICKHIIKEGFHSYIHLTDALIEYKFSFDLISVKALVECTIPKGSKYFLGYDDFALECYCSDNIIITKILKEK